MKKKFIVKYNREFDKIIKKRKIKKSNSFYIYYDNNNLAYDRFGVSVSKKLGNAVFRNKYKRKIRAIIDKYKKYYNNHKDYIIIMREKALTKKHEELEQELFELLNKKERINNEKKPKKI